jgi:DNA repair protein RecO (recombination protein O)
VGLYRDQGIVLRTWRLGESDRIVNLLTERHGKVRAVVKGVRKTKSRFGSRLEPMVHCSLLFYEGRELDIVTQAEALEVFRPVREDLARLAKASSLLEATDQLAQERHAAPRLYAMLLGGLRALAAHDAALLVPAFFLKLLSTEGFHPLLDECAVCGGRYGLSGFDLAQGGVLCVSCTAGRGGDDVSLSDAGLDLVRRILGGDLVGALAAPVTPATTEVERLATRAMEHHLERRLRSVPVAGALAAD